MSQDLNQLPVKKITLFFLTAIVLQYSSMSQAANANDSTIFRPVVVTAAENPVKNFYPLDTGLLRGRPAKFQQFWDGDGKGPPANSWTTTTRRCPYGFTPSLAYALKSTDDGDGVYAGHVVLQMDFDPATYRIRNVAAYIDRDTRNGQVGFQWTVFCNKKIN